MVNDRVKTLVAISPVVRIGNIPVTETRQAETQVMAEIKGAGPEEIEIRTPTATRLPEPRRVGHVVSSDNSGSDNGSSDNNRSDNSGSDKKAGEFSRRKIAVFVDVQNIYYTTRQAYGRQFNYRELWRRIEAQGEIVTALAYAIHRGDDKQLAFQNALKHIGFTVKLKPYIQRRDGSAKGDWDVGIAIDVLDKASNVDNVVLLSGDGDFDLLLEKIKRDCNVVAEVYGVPSLTANSLIDSADIFHPIEEELLL
jgi:uncharacterized LabA/DUF88 family protein